MAAMMLLQLEARIHNLVRHFHRSRFEGAYYLLLQSSLLACQLSAKKSRPGQPEHKLVSNERVAVAL
jgi:hypothetical protein